MKFLFTDLFKKWPANRQEENPVVVVDDSIHNITDGSEFLDDAIRMKEQPFMFEWTEVRMAGEVSKELY